VVGNHDTYTHALAFRKHTSAKREHAHAHARNTHVHMHMKWLQRTRTHAHTHTHTNMFPLHMRLKPCKTVLFAYCRHLQHTTNCKSKRDMIGKNVCEFSYVDMEPVIRDSCWQERLHMHRHTHIHTLHISLCMHACMHVCVYLSMNMCTYGCTRHVSGIISISHVYKTIFTRCIYLYACMHACIYPGICVYIDILDIYLA
jgi:hypothetical protein